MPGEAFDQIVITPAPCDGTKLALAALFVEDFEGEFGLVDRAGIVAEATHDAGVDNDAVRAVALGGAEMCDGFQFGQTF